MNTDQLRLLAERTERAARVDRDLAASIVAGLQSAFSEEAASKVLGRDVIESADAILALVNRLLPGWAISLEGTASESDSSWTCTLRESRNRDDDRVIGFGNAATLPLAVAAALLRTAVRPGDNR